MSVALKSDAARTACYPLGHGEVLLLAGDDVKLCDLAARAEKWSVKLPPKPVLNMEARDALNARFAKLQQWADALAAKRSALTTPQATLQFNKEVAKYQAELQETRASAANALLPRQIPTPVVTAAVRTSSAPEHVFGGDRSKIDRLNAPVGADLKMVEERIKKRSPKIAAIAGGLEAKRAAAKTEIQKMVVRDEERKLAALNAEQKADEDTLAKLGATPPEPVLQTAPVVSAQQGFSATATERQAALLGSVVWVVDGTHAVALDHASGQVKQDVPLAGVVRKVFRGEARLHVLAQAGPENCQITRLAADGAPQSLYMSMRGSEGPYHANEDGGTEAIVQPLRVEFAGNGVRADIRLIERKLKARAMVNPGAEKKLTQTIAGAAGNSQEELLAISKLMANDAQRLMGAAKELVDDSTYEVTLRNPFEASAPVWTGRLRGRVQLISTPHFHFLTAGTQLFAFTQDNNKIWEATLGAPVPIREDDSGSQQDEGPWLEAGSRLLLADGAFLTSFDIASGQVQWRLPSVGIRKIQIDVNGGIYIASDNLPTESLYYAHDADSSLTNPSVMKVSAEDGKILWQADKFENVWTSGQEVYAYRQLHNAADFQNAVFDRSKVPEGRTKIYKLSRSTGKVRWEWYQSRLPRTVIPEHKNVALLFGDELQVIHSISF